MLNRKNLSVSACVYATLGALSVSIFACGAQAELSQSEADSTGASQQPLLADAGACAVGVVAVGVGFFAGGPDNDDVTGGPQGDILSGAECDDILGGAGGDDVLDGDSGNDELNGGGQNDRLRGGGGSDTLVGSVGFDVLSGGPGVDFLFGGPDDDLLVAGPGDDELDGDQGCDICIGDPGDEFVDCEVIIVDDVLTTPAGATCPDAPQPEALVDFLNE